ncbi:hypothetical protein [Planctomicrobium piriforme]|uniref:Uncharacterized protein n=1 Tax=Planctomicrobium piriforme TaxID=1576369 RepID=A0A1I3QXI8_9PLAN|nr:hypothetical protein [Planctomicrobium piriforme]SFJ38460.1 hypothetical protein SAMN05421753_11978 [Planctomicrobium piriforme]
MNWFVTETMELVTSLARRLINLLIWPQSLEESERGSTPLIGELEDRDDSSV